MHPLPDRLPLSLHFDPALLVRDLQRLEEHSWIDHFVKENYTGQWDVLPLRGTAGATHPVMMIYSDPACREFADTPFLEQAPYLREVLGAFRCPLLSVRLMRLTPGSEIKEHRDYDLSAELGQVRLHVPITTNPGVEFLLNGTRVLINDRPDLAKEAGADGVGRSRDVGGTRERRLDSVLCLLRLARLGAPRPGSGKGLVSAARKP